MKYIIYVYNYGTFYFCSSGDDSSQVNHMVKVAEPTGPSTSSSSSSVSSEARWTEKEVYEFLDICLEEDVANGNKNTQKWQRICELLAGKGYMRTKEMCKNKWTKLKTEYMKWVQSQKRTGAAGQGHRFSEAMDQILGEKHHVNPVVLYAASGVATSSPSALVRKTTVSSQPRSSVATTSSSTWPRVNLASSAVHPSPSFSPSPSLLDVSGAAAEQSVRKASVVATSSSSPLESKTTKVSSQLRSSLASSSLSRLGDSCVSEEPAAKKSKVDKKTKILAAVNDMSSFQQELLKAQERQTAEICASIRGGFSELAAAIRSLAESKSFGGQ